MRLREPKPIAQETRSRRSWLEWVGGATAVTLGSDVLTACAALGSSADGRGDAPSSGDAYASFPFSPGAGTGSGTLSGEIILL